MENDQATLNKIHVRASFPSGVTLKKDKWNEEVCYANIWREHPSQRIITKALLSMCEECQESWYVWKLRSREYKLGTKGGGMVVMIGFFS